MTTLDASCNGLRTVKSIMGYVPKLDRLTLRIVREGDGTDRRHRQPLAAPCSIWTEWTVLAAAWARLVEQPVQPPREKSAAPFADRVLGHVHITGDGGRGASSRASQNQSRTQRLQACAVVGRRAHRSSVSRKLGCRRRSGSRGDGYSG